ncbi:MAG: FHA domain-containing protein [Myxococcaceae bacterium]
MAPSNPKRPPRRPPPDDGAKDSEDTGELPFDEREATPLNADDPAPQRVTTYPVRAGRKRRAGRDTVGSPSMVATVAGVTDQEVFLYAEHGPGTGQLLPIAEGALILGRSSSCDLRLPHASISRRHARLTRRGERLFLEDLGSQNGTFLDDERLAGPREL